MVTDNQADISFAFSSAPEAGQTRQIVPGVDWIRLPLPFALDHVNCWYLSGQDDTCLIDSGVNKPETLACWNSVIANKGIPQKLLITHFHPDHSGLAGGVAKQGCDVLSSEIEWDIVQKINAIDDAPYQDFYAQWYMHNGVDASYVRAVYKMGNTYKFITHAPPSACEFLCDGDAVTLGGRQFSVIAGQGHSPDMLMLYSEADALLIAADQILPSITPNVSLMPLTTDPNPLKSFLDCTEKLRALPEETLVLPSHGLPFTGLHQRIDFLQAHHQQRLDEILSAVHTEQTAAGLFPLLFKRKLDNQQLSFALGETLAHLVFLEKKGLIERENRDDVDYFRAL